MDESNDPELEHFFDMLAFLLVEHGGMRREEAEQIVYEDGNYKADTPMARMMLLHELPYHWAMSRLNRGRRSPWYHDPALWPPPADWFRSYDEAKESGRW